ncbi:MAG: hypothetical protein BRC36_03310 [Cyanobacteria bacterium QH_2_48_84]|nr:MAG: hypothetical protein BRC36_03310 [Cyanobacteria bacterium QH_2_48_84]
MQPRLIRAVVRAVSATTVATSRGHRQCQLPSLPPALTKWWQRRDVSYGIFSPILAYLNQIERWWKVAQEWDEAVG